ncbi:hypothetical protein [Pedobacter miscanthi]|uniref:hypothetical protein n=1 Tax=Pedobacter miscanthi TaxID=2259170 RepID=UPI0029302232|nr:hypothetical protein [Pedobacter miscanthi]
MKTQEMINNLMDVAVEYNQIGKILITQFGYKRNYYPEFQENLEFEYMGEDLPNHVIMFNLEVNDYLPIIGIPKEFKGNEDINAAINLYVENAFDVIQMRFEEKQLLIKISYN